MSERRWVYAINFQPGQVILTNVGLRPIINVEPEAGQVRITVEGGYSFVSVPLAGVWVNADD